MSQVIGETTHLLRRLGSGDEQARSDLIKHACERLRRLAARMLRDFPGVRRWEQTDDVWQNALIRLYKALETQRPQTSLHFRRLAALQIRRVLLDLVDHHTGPNGHGAHHHTDHGVAADEPGGVLGRQAVYSCPPSSAAGWAEFLDRIKALPEDEQGVVDLLWVQGLGQAEAAGLMGVSVRTVKRRWQSARLRLAGHQPE